jgi:hypothetical protein
MEGVTKVRFTLKSLSPILFNKHHDEQDSTNQAAQKHVPLKCHRDTDGNIAIPSDMLKSAVVFGAGDVGPAMKKRSRQQLMKSAVFFDKPMYTVGGKEHDFVSEEWVTRPGIGGKKSSVVSMRPGLKEWSFTGVAFLYGVDPEEFEQYLRMAGMRYGLGSHRPQYGRFEITKYEVLKD